MARRPHPRMAGRTVYAIHALGATGAPATNDDPTAAAPTAHRVSQLVDWVGHVADLGAGAVLLTPVFASTTHGYDTVDPFRLDQRLGGDDDLAGLVAACHDRDLLVLLDGVFNHVGRDFPRFVDVREHGRDSRWTDWFVLHFDADGPDGFGYEHFEGHDSLVALDHANPAVLDWAVEVACHWLEHGVDGWRLDAAYAVPTDFWAAFADRVRERFPDVYLVGEVIHGDYAAFVDAAHLDSVTQYELHKSVWSALNDVNLHELAWNLRRHADFARSFTPLVFLSNHDVTRLLTKLDDPEVVGHALAVLFTVPGTPAVYYLDELAAEGEKTDRPGGDDAVRPPLPADATPADDEQQRLRDLHRTLIAVRRARPWLDTAHLEVTEVTNGTLRVLLDGDDHAVELVLALDASVSSTRGWHGIAGHGVGEPVHQVPAGHWAILER
jgi:cyclomaltodextrinase